jgi:CheY-like chemotaxis protein
MAFDNDIINTRALVVDSNATSRSVLIAQLREFGVGTVRHTARLKDAREILENENFDIVLCDYHFENSETTGQDLLDELRREGLLPYPTVFVMVTGEASYAKVVEAAETALDSYLIKPYTGTALHERLNEARRRKRVLKPIFLAIEANDFQTAASLCTKRFLAREEYWLYAARVGAELCLRLNQTANARLLYEAVVKSRALPWARLGVARAQAAAGELVPARRTLAALINDLPDHADAYDVLGGVQVDQGELAAALETYRQSARLTPDSVNRLQQAGMLAFYGGERAEAMRLLDQASALGSRSKMLDTMVLMQLALLKLDTRDGKGLQQVNTQLQRRLERTPNDVRTQRFARVTEALVWLNEHRSEDATRSARAISDEVDAPDFDLDAACAVVALRVRLAGLKLTIGEIVSPVRRIAQRFCISHAASEMLVACASGQSEAVEAIRQSHAAVSAAAEKAMGHALKGDPRRAVESLLDEGEQSHNAKLIELAGLVAQRHRERIDGVDRLTARVADLRLRYCANADAARQSSRRAPGGLRLRA